MPDEPIELEDENEPNEDDTEELAVEEGEICANCGLEFVAVQVVPSLCPACWKNASKEEREVYRESTHDVIASD